MRKTLVLTLGALVLSVAAFAQDMPVDYAGVLKMLAPRELTGRLDTAQLAKILRQEGEQNGAVYKITIGRPDIPLKEMGATINARMGLNTWAAFYGTDAETVVAGDVAMVAPEVTPVLKTLRANGIDVVAIHHHMTGTDPAVVFLHYWGKGPAQKLATVVKTAIDQTGKGGQAAH